MSTLQFMLNEKLPWKSHVAISITSHAPKLGTVKMNKVMFAYTKHLVAILQKSFSSENIISRSSIDNT